MNTEYQKMIDRLLSLKGQIVTMETRKSLKTRKGLASLVEKQSVFQARVGVSYDNISRVIEGRENGTLPGQNAGLPWGVWVIYPYVIEHKGKLYFRFSGVKNSFVPKASFFVDGKEAKKEEVCPLVLASEVQEKESPEVFNFALENLLAIH
jgi:hypothetical protein